MPCCLEQSTHAFGNLDADKSVFACNFVVAEVAQFGVSFGMNGMCLQHCTLLPGQAIVEVETFDVWAHEAGALFDTVAAVIA